MLDSQPIFANGLGGLLLITTVFFGCLGLLIAALLEMAVFWLLLRRRFWRIAGVVLAANVLSAFIGGLPAALRTSMLKWDITTDPGSVYTHYWDGFLPLVLSLLGLTLLIEFICVLPLALRRWGGARISRLIAGTAVGNLLSYAVLVGIIYYLPAWAEPARGHPAGGHGDCLVPARAEAPQHLGDRGSLRLLEVRRAPAGAE
jgi:hypothetical protein